MSIELAIESGDYNKVQSLLESGIDPNSSDFLVPLIHQARDMVMLELLLKYGADPNISFNGTLLSIAADSNDIAKAKLLLKYGADPNDCGGLTPPLVYAFENNNVPMLSFLLESGANPNEPFNILNSYIRTGNFDDVQVVEVLVKHGAKYTLDIDNLINYYPNDLRFLLKISKYYNNIGNLTKDERDVLLSELMGNRNTKLGVLFELAFNNPGRADMLEDIIIPNVMKAVPRESHSLNFTNDDVIQDHEVPVCGSD